MAEQFQLWTPYTTRDNTIILTGDPMPEEGTVLVGERAEVPICVHPSSDPNQTDHSECAPTVQSILLTNPNHHSDDVARQVEGTWVEVWRV